MKDRSIVRERNKARLRALQDWGAATASCRKCGSGLWPAGPARPRITVAGEHPHPGHVWCAEHGHDYIERDAVVARVVEAWRAYVGADEKARVIGTTQDPGEGMR